MREESAPKRAVTTGALSAMGEILIDPEGGFRKIDALPRRAFLVPLVTIVATTLLLLYYYYTNVDIAWLREYMQPNATVAERQALENLLTRNTLLLIAAVSSIITLPLLYAIFALYFFLIAKVLDVPHGFGSWFAFVVWTSVPSILLVPVGLYVTATSPNGQVAPEQLNPATLNTMIFALPSSDAWATLLSSISFATLWTVVLMAVGLRWRARLSRLKSGLLVSAPYAVVYGTWAAVILTVQRL